MNILRTLIRAATAASITGGAFAMPLGAFLLHEQTVEQWSVETQASERQAAMVWTLPTDAALPPAPTPAPEAKAPSSESAPSELGIEGSAGTPVASKPMLAAAHPGPSRASVRKAAREAAEDEAATKARKKKGVVCEESHETIDRVSGHTWAVERDLLTFYARHPGKLDDLGWVARHEDDAGDADGFRLGGIQCGSELLSAGFQNGDVVHSVNGRTITSVGQALLAWAALKRSETLTVVISRRGKEKTLVYHLA